MKTAYKLLEFQTKEELDIIDFTNKIIEFAKEGRIKNGLINIQTLHTTAPLFVNENEPLLLKDFKNHLAKSSAKDAEYNHNNFEIRTENMCENESKNGHSHCQALHLPSSIVLNLINGEVQLGQWQRVFLVELDKSKPRKVQIQIVGE